MDTDQTFKNNFLISLPALKGDYFQNTISLLIDHNDQGAFGLVINQPLENKIGELLPELDGCCDCPVLIGGPVEQESLFFLHPAGSSFTSTLQISDDISLTTSPDFIEALKAGEEPPKTIALLGYAGWGSEQLEHELSKNVWLLAPVAGHIVFDEPYASRASAAAKLMGVDLNLISPRAGHD
ncbi:MAG TPA: YqgE/AlgH family protein [Pseudomonadales bacterium]|jgi:putative transcriptional regulator|nr:YqgE/AlgH family protein [Pseudomonadales bacterium]MDP6315138.1 YqgE/AlgH family protein [Pseudomonadales bacterium]MDP7314443.1 YqgE/AlgH family protein [Pseudomonadales bacterium]MDP7575444.1 YqgE/AlgH family protein [Pseudomonadales bacterium]HJL61871.1 YqgE/AlgH family protein [Pseudomonadales bacterium]|tara:strand:- start:593 stop:1138 length:546 start_codon:yes stop_codon:yes gene_type:complete